MGLRLRWLEDGTDRLSWADVAAMTREALPGSAVLRWVDPWDIDTHLLAGVLDALNGANWQRSGGRGGAPRPVPRPDTARPVRTVEDEDVPDGYIPSVDESGTYTGVSTPVDELAEWLGWTESRPMSRDELMADRYLSGGLTYHDIAEEFGVSESTVGRAIRANRG